jgi:hypothetical protein
MSRYSAWMYDFIVPRRHCAFAIFLFPYEFVSSQVGSKYLAPLLMGTADTCLSAKYRLKVDTVLTSATNDVMRRLPILDAPVCNFTWIQYSNIQAPSSYQTTSCKLLSERD